MIAIKKKKNRSRRYKRGGGSCSLLAAFLRQTDERRDEHECTIEGDHDANDDPEGGAEIGDSEVEGAEQNADRADDQLANSIKDEALNKEVKAREDKPSANAHDDQDHEIDEDAKRQPASE